MRPTRIYAHHRRAWTPRLWPLLLVSAALCLALTTWLRPSAVGAFAIGVGLALLIGVGRWELWKWRHPIISTDEYITDYLQRQREHARWN